MPRLSGLYSTWLVGAVPPPGSARQLLHVRDIEVRHAPVTDFARLRAAPRTPRPFRPADGCRASAADRGRSGRCAAASGCARTPPARRCARRCADSTLLTMNSLVAPAGDRLADDLLGAAVAVHLGGVDQRHAEIDAEPQRRHLLLRRATRSRPCARCPGRAPAPPSPSGSRTVRIMPPPPPPPASRAGSCRPTALPARRGHSRGAAVRR